MVSWNTMFVGYVECGTINKACELFNIKPQRKVLSRNPLLSIIHKIIFLKVLGTFKKMQLESIKQNYATFSSILLDCAKMEVLEHGMDNHQSIKGRSILLDFIVTTALVDVYEKCGSI